MNPAGSELLEQARKFRQDFHWGIPARKVVTGKIPPRPRVLVKLGRLESVVYRTNKKGDGLSHYEHEFSEDGGKKPSLCVDPSSGKLHIVGGSYRVEERGIVD